MNGVGNQFVEQELSLFGNEHGLFRDGVVREVLLDVCKIPFNRNDMFLQEACKVAGYVLVNTAERGLRCLGHGEHAIHGFN